MPGYTGSSKIKGAKLGEESSARADGLSIGWPFCQAELRWEFQTGGILFSHMPLHFLFSSAAALPVCDGTSKLVRARSLNTTQKRDQCQQNLSLYSSHHI